MARLLLLGTAMVNRWLSLAQLLALLASAASCAPSTHTQNAAPTQSEPMAGANASEGPRDDPQPRAPMGDLAGPQACVAAGGRCVIGGINCTQRGPQDCNPTRNPGGAVCCLKETAPTIGPSPAPAVDAGTAAGRGAAGSSAGGASGGGGSAGDAADSGTDPVEPVDYSCETDADCTIKNVGNCCGYFPRCVNKDRPVPAFVCPPGVGGVCGWPEIDRCSCKQKTCRSLQGDQEV